MSETPLFLTLSGVSAFLVSAYIISNRLDAVSRAAAQTFYWLSIGLSVAAFLWVTLDALGWLPVTASSIWWFRVLIYRAWLVIGTAISCAVLLTLHRCMGEGFVALNNATRSFLASPYVLKGVSLSVSISFFSAEVGKLAHDAEMRQFFLQSGYPVWFLYSTMIAETAGAFGLLFRRTAVLAALGLSAIMIGAMATHAHNRDPFSDSLEALHLLILLACILALRLPQTSVASSR